MSTIKMQITCCQRHLFITNLQFSIVYEQMKIAKKGKTLSLFEIPYIQ